MLGPLGPLGLLGLRFYESSGLALVQRSKEPAAWLQRLQRLHCVPFQSVRHAMACHGPFEAMTGAYGGMTSETGGVVSLLETISADFARLEADTKSEETIEPGPGASMGQVQAKGTDGSALPP